MSWKEHGKYILMALIAISLVIFVFVLLVKNIGGKDNTPANQSNSVVEYLTTDSTMELTVQGPIVANDEYRSVKITVNSSEVTLDLRKGYDNESMNSKTYANNADAYKEFVRALSILNYSSGNSDKKLADESGYCPTGNRYIYGIQNNGNEVQRYWSGSCTAGTFTGEALRIRSLFRAQVPDYGQVVQDTDNFSLGW